MKTQPLQDLAGQSLSPPLPTREVARSRGGGTDERVIGSSRWDEQIGLFNNEATPTRILFHQFEPHLVAADDKGIIRFVSPPSVFSGSIVREGIEADRRLLVFMIGPRESGLIDSRMGARRGVGLQRSSSATRTTSPSFSPVQVRPPPLLLLSPSLLIYEW